jgi:hypothetical protein
MTSEEAVIRTKEAFIRGDFSFGADTSVSSKE